MLLRFLLALASLVAGTASASAQDHPAAAERSSPVTAPGEPRAWRAEAAVQQEPSVLDRLWRFTRWYDNPSNPIVQRVLFSGRYQHDFALVRADQGDHDEWNVRRLRLGNRVTLLRRFLVHVEAELNPQERDPLYVRLTDAYVQWSRGEAVVTTFGKQGVPFTMDGSTSSRELIAIDRSNLTNNMWFPQEYMPGASVSGRHRAWQYRAGVYSAGAANRELGTFSGSLFTLVAIGHDLARAAGVKKALIAGQYVYQPEDPDNTFTRRLAHVGSINVDVEAGRVGVRADVTGALGYLNQSDLWGAMAMPFADVTDSLQLVGRYTHVSSRHPDGVSLATYENRVTAGRGDRYDEGYVGANYYFYGHRLKLQTGVQFARMRDRGEEGGEYSGMSWVTGIRVGW